MKWFVVTLSVFSQCLNSFAGCPNPYLKVGKNIYYYWVFESGESDTLDPSASTLPVRVVLNYKACSSVSLAVIFNNTDTLGYIVGDYYSLAQPEFPNLAGHYVIKGPWWHHGSPGIILWEFDIVRIIKDEDISTSLIDLEEVNPDLLFYPNPASDVLNIKNESGELLNVQIYSALGELIYEQKPQGFNTSIPLENWPKGVYTVFVATLSEKTIIKKLLVQ